MSASCEHEWIETATFDDGDCRVYLCTICRVGRADKAAIAASSPHANLRHEG